MLFLLHSWSVLPWKFSFISPFHSEIIRILHGCEMRVENSVLRSLWCRIVIPRERIFYPHRTLMFDSFSCIPFNFECFILKVAFITIHNDDDEEIFLTWLHCDIVNIIVMLQWRQPNYKIVWRPIQPMQTEFTWKFSFLDEITWVR